MSVRRLLAACLFCATITPLAGCDAAKKTAADALMQPPGGKKSLHAPQEWTLSDQSRLSAVIEVVETSEASFGTLALQRTAPQPLKSLELSFHDHATGQPHGEWMPVPAASLNAGLETFRIPLSAPAGTQVVFRVHVGEQPEVLAPWTLAFSEN